MHLRLCYCEEFGCVGACRASIGGLSSQHHWTSRTTGNIGQLRTQYLPNASHCKTSILVRLSELSQLRIMTQRFFRNFQHHTGICVQFARSSLLGQPGHDSALRRRCKFCPFSSVEIEHVGLLNYHQGLSMQSREQQT